VEEEGTCAAMVTPEKHRIGCFSKGGPRERVIGYGGGMGNGVWGP
jgi:hypothetical protein